MYIHCCNSMQELKNCLSSSPNSQIGVNTLVGTLCDVAVVPGLVGDAIFLQGCCAPELVLVGCTHVVGCGA